MWYLLGEGYKQRIRAGTQAKHFATQSEELPTATTTANIPAANIQQHPLLVKKSLEKPLKFILSSFVL